MEDKRMSEQNPYQKLDVSKDASFEEIQSARDRLFASQDDEQARMEVEAAYDAILMDRLRQRQTGELEVPERIRYAEQLAEPTKKLTLPTFPKLGSSPAWLERALDRPSVKELGISSGVLGGLAVLAYLSQANPDGSALILALGIGFNIYWINRKDLKLGRAVLLTLLGIVVGGVLGALGLSVLQSSLPGLDVTVVLTLVVLAIFWLISNFLR
jgi:hypothetical protein